MNQIPDKLKYIETKHQKGISWDETLEPGVDLGNTYPSVPCPTCAASWFEGCNRVGFCPERIEAMEVYDSLPEDVKDHIKAEDWKRFLAWRKQKDKSEKEQTTGQMRLF